MTVSFHYTVYNLLATPVLRNHTWYWSGHSETRM